jgi:hypothetical protein
MDEFTIMVLLSIAASFFVTGGLARASNRSVSKWTALSLLLSPLVGTLLLLAVMIIHGKGTYNEAR